MSVMTSAAIVCIDVVETQIGPINSQHVDGKIVMSVEVVHLMISRGHHVNVGPV